MAMAIQVTHKQFIAIEDYKSILIDKNRSEIFQEKYSIKARHRRNRL